MLAAFTDNTPQTSTRMISKVQASIHRSTYKYPVTNTVTELTEEPFTSYIRQTS